MYSHVRASPWAGRRRNKQREAQRVRTELDEAHATAEMMAATAAAATEGEREANAQRIQARAEI